MRSVYDLIASGKLTPTITTIPFEDILAGLERLSNGTVGGRLVARIGY